MVPEDERFKIGIWLRESNEKSEGGGFGEIVVD